ncbi:carboxymuconolactone decarboxylase family protein [Desulfurococcus mucosus]|uniref:Alkylhydroperoxidase like protein, AhpD family n=1 Tax=Desulfurococcus mucosus (strain ATCC 35584 / DSM 2162 / JCM 9187 / O7/1) TaxID=765177 RepID=E8R8X1_DESM0|nr:carboxymuconolactone decarboxylase family protein [Desulfurococcus mucosus]ADV64947.1 alkylhydroperoxidase like protein, AhpD family [Desulfurococcus mucosus DSM 2162]
MTYRGELEKLSSTLMELVSKAPELQGFVKYIQEAESPAVLDAKTKELISLGIAIAVRCEPCIIWHTDAALKAGASLNEILDVIKVAVCMGGGPALMYASKAYIIAKEFASEKQGTL